MLTDIPVDGHFAQGLFGTPPVVGHHGHELAHVQDLDDAPAVFHLGRVHAFDFAVEHGARRHRRMQHAGQLRVDAVFDLAHHDVGNVHAGNGLADQRPVFRVFECDIFGRFELGGGCGQLAVTQAAFAGRMGDLAQRGLAFAGGHAPLLGCSGHQHVACRGTRLAQIGLRIADGAAAHRGHVPISAFGAQVLMCGGVLDANFLPVGIQLFRDDHGRGRHAALAHFGAGITNDDGVVRLDLHPDVELRRVRARGCAGTFGHKKAQRHTGRGTAADL